MAIHSQGINLILFHELKRTYPEVPDSILTDHMKQNRNNKQRCIEALSTEKYLFGLATPVSTDPLSTNLRDLSLEQSDPRRRSDSASSGMSNSSSCSVSSSGLPNSAQKPTVPSPPSKNETFVTLEPRHLTPFVQQPNYPSQIPQIHCNTHTSSTLYKRNPSQGDMVHSQDLSNVVYTTPNSPPSQSRTKREIKVYQVPGMPGPREISSLQSPYSVYSTPPSYKVELGIPSSQQAEFSNQPYLIQHTVPARQNNYRTESQLMFQNQHISVPFGQTSSQFVGQHGENHSSQASIVLNHSSTGRVSPERPIPLVPNTGQPHLMVPSYSDPQIAPHNISISPTNLGPVHSAQSVTQTHGDPSYTTPLFVTLSSAEGLPVQYKMNEPGLSGHSTLPVRNDNYGNYVNLVPSQIPPQSYVGRVIPDMTSAGTLPSVTSQGSVGQIYRHYSAMQDRCMVPGHPQGPVRTGSLDNETASVVINPNIERVVQTPVQVMSPASSHSSLSSESSLLENQRRRSGSLQEEQAYIQALNHHQIQRMEKLKQDLDAHSKELAKIALEVKQMESNKLEGQRSRRHSHVFPSIDDAAKLRDQNHRLQADIDVMVREIDMYNKGQIPLGVYDPLEQQSFYKNMNTGPQGSIYSQPKVTTPSRDVPPPLPPRPNHNPVPPPPPPQPSAGSGDSDDGEQWSCSACTFLNHPALKTCECCEMPRTVPLAAICGGHSSSIGSNLTYAGS
ncbi:hypothetical protein ScPMuIL_012685 [Solemya velum]